MDLHKAHHHSHLLEKELENKKSTERKKSKPFALRITLLTRGEQITNQPDSLFPLPCSATYLSDTGITHPDDIEESGHDLGQELDTLEAQRLKDEGDGLDDHSMVVRERRVSEDAHQSDNCHSGVKLIQGQVAHVH